MVVEAIVLPIGFGWGAMMLTESTRDAIVVGLLILVLNGLILVSTKYVWRGDG